MRQTFFVALSCFLAFVIAQKSTLDINRDDTKITITNNAPSSDGARSIFKLTQCKDGFTSTIFYGPVEGFVETLTQEARLISSVVVVEAPTDNADEENTEQDRVELYNANLTFGRPPCIDTEETSEDPIRLEQGRSVIFGERLVLEPEENVGDMSGPVKLEREAEGESPALSADADSLKFNFDTEISTFQGNITVTSEDRVSKADELEFDEVNGIAIMKGSPATSTQGNDSVQGEVIKYFLNNNDVVVIGGISGEIEVELDE